MNNKRDSILLVYFTKSMFDSNRFSSKRPFELFASTLVTHINTFDPCISKCFQYILAV